MRADLDGIEALAKRLNLRANLHIHSGDHMTAQAPIVWDLIRDRDPKAIGAYVDPGHMFTEGGRDGWRQGLDLLGDRIALVAVKDVAWEAHDSLAPVLRGEGGGEGLQTRIGESRDFPNDASNPSPQPAPLSTGEREQRRWRVVPLGSGIVDWVAVFICLRQLNFNGWMSMHSEYKDLTADQVLAQTQDDLHYLRQAVGL